RRAPSSAPTAPARSTPAHYSEDSGGLQRTSLTCLRTAKETSVASLLLARGVSGLVRPTSPRATSCKIVLNVSVTSSRPQELPVVAPRSAERPPAAAGTADARSRVQCAGAVPSARVGKRSWRHECWWSTTILPCSMAYGGR